MKAMDKFGYFSNHVSQNNQQSSEQECLGNGKRIELSFPAMNKNASLSFESKWQMQENPHLLK
jgi:hypothetical protein